MREYETVTEEHTSTHCVRVLCDLCGIAGRDGGWDCGNYEFDKTELQVKVSAKKGKCYPDDYYGKKFVVDLCPDCFRSKLLPWLRSQGAEIKEQEFGR